MEESTTVICVECEGEIDTENDCFREVENGGLCPDCEHEVLERASTVMMFDPLHDPIMLLVTDYGAIETDSYEESDWARRVWKPIVGGGYYETTVKNMTEVKGLSGWTSGWVDETVQRKIDFNQWATDLREGEIVPPVEVAITADPTSNIFSMAIGVHVKPEDLEEFTAWLGEKFDILASALG